MSGRRAGAAPVAGRDIRWDAAAGQFLVGRVSANTWRWTRTDHGWRVAERVNANLDGTPQNRQLLAPTIHGSGIHGSAR